MRAKIKGWKIVLIKIMFQFKKEYHTELYGEED